MDISDNIHFNKRRATNSTYGCLKQEQLDIRHDAKITNTTSGQALLNPTTVKSDKNGYGLFLHFVLGSMGTIAGRLGYKPGRQGLENITLSISRCTWKDDVQ